MKRLVSDGIRWTVDAQKFSPPSRNPFLLPFHHESPWVLPRATGAIFEPETSRATKYLRATDINGQGIDVYVNNNLTGFSHPIKRAGVSDPWHSVNDATHAPTASSAGGYFGYRIPTDAYSDPQTDSHIHVVRADARYVYEWWGIGRTGPTTFESLRQYRDITVTAQSPAIAYAETAQTISVVDTSTSYLTVSNHDYISGTPIVFGPTPPAPLIAGTTYFVTSPTTDTIRVASTEEDAQAGSYISLTTTTAGASVRFGDGARVVFAWLKEDSSQDFSDVNSLGNLKRGISYYTKNCTSTGFSIAVTKNGSVINPDTTGLGVVMCMSEAAWKGRVKRVNLYGSGLGPQNGTRAYGGSGFGGLIRTWEVLEGKIYHPIAIAISSRQFLVSGGSSGYDANGYGTALGYVWPATEQDFSSVTNTGYGYNVTTILDNGDNTLTLAGHDVEIGTSLRASQTIGGLTSGTRYYVVEIVSANKFRISTAPNSSPLSITTSASTTIRLSGAVPMGTYFCLPSDFDENTQMATEAGKILARAYRDYGGYVTDGAGDYTFVMAQLDFDVPSWFREQLRTGKTGPLWGELRTIQSQFRVVQNNSVSTPNGGSLGDSRLAALSPEFDR